MKKEIKEIIKEEKRNSTQRGLAKKLGISEQYLSHILNGRRKCPANIERKLKKYLSE
jgi:transcriptional regulator with XRE-family HTH domain